MSKPSSAGCALATLLLLLLPRGADAADDKEPAVAEPQALATERPKLKRSVFLVSANLGLLVTSGNSNVVTFTGGAFVSWKDPNNRLTFDGSFAFARQYTLTATDDNGNGVIEQNEIHSSSKAGAQNWYAKPRYDRYLTENDSVFVAGVAGADILAGKQFYGGGQVGYARTIYSAEPHEIVGEVGYDFTHEEYVETADGSLDIHSARLFAGYRLKLADDIFLQTALEGLSNFVPEDTPTGRVSALEDLRLNWKNSLSAKVWKNISGRFSFTARFDNAPAPRPAFDLPYAPGVVVPADKLDTLTELAVVVNFL